MACSRQTGCALTHTPVHADDVSCQYEEVRLLAMHWYVLVPVKPIPQIRDSDDEVQLEPTVATWQAVRIA